MALTTPRKDEANRDNAGKSTGPRTPEGKARSAANALKHGFYAVDPVIPGEDEDQYEGVRSEYYRDLCPRGVLERSLVEHIVACSWRLERLRRYEGTVLEELITDQVVIQGTDRVEQRLGPRLGDYIHRMLTDGTMEKLSRLEQRMEKSLYRALAEFRTAQQLRRVAEAEAAAQSKPAPWVPDARWAAPPMTPTERHGLRGTNPNAENSEFPPAPAAVPPWPEPLPRPSATRQTCETNPDAENSEFPPAPGRRPGAPGAGRAGT